MHLLSEVLGRLRRPDAFGSMARVIGLRSLAIGVNILTGLITAAALGPAGRGEQAALTVAPQFLGPLAIFGLHASLIYNSKADPAHDREYFGANLLMTALTGVAMTGIGWIVEPYWLHQYDPHTILLGRILLCTLPFTVITGGMLGAAEARGWFELSNGTLYVQSLFTLLLLVLLWRLHRLTPHLAAIAYIAPTIPALLYFLWRVCGRLPPIFTLRAPFPRRLLQYGLRFYGIDLVGTLSTYLDQLIVVAVLPARAVGIYAVALSSARMLTIVQQAVSSVLFPSVAGRGTGDIVDAVAATMRATTGVTAIGVAVLALIGPVLLHLLYGQRFAGAVAPFRILLCDVLVISAARILYQAYSGSGRPEWVTLFEAIGVGSSIVLMLLIIPRLGLLGATLAVLASSVIRLGCTLAGLPLLLSVPMPRLLLNRGDIQAWLMRPPLMPETGL